MPRRFILVATIIFLFVSQAMISSASDSRASISHPKQCQVSSHLHRYSDLRIKAIQIEKVDACGFEYSDIEDRTITADLGGRRLNYASGFELVRAQKQKVDRRDQDAVERGMKGTAIVCSDETCRQVFTLQLLPAE